MSKAEIDGHLPPLRPRSRANRDERMTDYTVSSGVTSTGLVLGSSDDIFICSGGTAVDSTAEHGAGAFIYS